MIKTNLLVCNELLYLILVIVKCLRKGLARLLGRYINLFCYLLFLLKHIPWHGAYNHMIRILAHIHV